MSMQLMTIWTFVNTTNIWLCLKKNTGNKVLVPSRQQTFQQETADVLENLIYMDPCIVAWISNNNQQDATL